MKKLLSAFSIFTAFTFNAFAQEATQTIAQTTIQEAPVNPNAADFKFEREVHDFGNMVEGVNAIYEFEFTNTGKEPLIIQNVRASCGCTTPSWTKEPIAPGQKGKIKAAYNSQGRPGAFNKAITVTSNAKTPTKVLYIKGNVEPAATEGAPEKKPALLAEPIK